MRRLALLSIGIGTLAIALVLTSGQAEKKVSVKKERKAPSTIATMPPSSLDALYPPKAKQPIFLLRKLGLGNRFFGIVADLSVNELQHSMANFETFKAQYIEASKLVPEWRENFPLGPVEELGTTLRTGDRSKIMAAHEKVLKVCHECHTAYMPKVQQKYHWGDFDAISINDPLTNKEVAFNQLMDYLDTNFEGISVSVERGDRETAQKQFQGFNARFRAMKEICNYCHDTERRYYVDGSVQALIDKLGEALSGSSVDQKIVEPLTQRIGMESCFKCHLVHIPAAFAKF